MREGFPAMREGQVSAFLEVRPMREGFPAMREGQVSPYLELPPMQEPQVGSSPDPDPPSSGAPRHPALD